MVFGYVRLATARAKHRQLALALLFCCYILGQFCMDGQAMVRLGSKHAADPAKFSARLNEETAAVTNAVSSGLSTVTQTLSEKLLDVSSSVPPPQIP